jgi:ketopantoate reductase
MADVIKEVSTIALAETRHLTDIDVDELTPERIHLFVQTVISETAANHSSMLQDIFAGRRGTEIDFLNGYLQYIGKSKHDVQTPANSFLCNQVDQLLQTKTSNVNIL